MSSVIKFLDLNANYSSLITGIKEEIDQSIIKNITDSQFIQGEDTKLFEKEFASFIGVKHCIGVGNGTDALEIAIQSLNLEPGSEIILQPNTFIATALGISNNNLIPVFVDINSDTLMIDHTQIESKITNKTRAICIVHLYGTSPNMDEILRIKKQYNLLLIEDCAQSHGSLYREQLSGTFGDIACFSFYPGKNLGCYGDGGAIVTNSSELFQCIKLIHNLGSEVKYHNIIKGRNSRLDTIQAGILRIKLKYLDKNNESRRQNAKLYNKLLKDVKGIKTISILENTIPVWHLYIIRVLGADKVDNTNSLGKNNEIHNREALQLYLKENGIETGIHYPIPIHKQKAYLEYNKESYPITEIISNEILSLPMYPELSHNNIGYICQKINDFFK